LLKLHNKRTGRTPQVLFDDPGAILFYDLHFTAKTKKEALKKVLEKIPKDNLVSWGGSMTLQEIGLIKVALKNEGYYYLAPAEPQEVEGLMV
jgi:hypothetical protein